MQEKGRYNARNCCVNSYITKRSSEAPHLTELRLVIQLGNPTPVETKKKRQTNKTAGAGGGATPPTGRGRRRRRLEPKGPASPRRRQRPVPRNEERRFFWYFTVDCFLLSLACLLKFSCSRHPEFCYYNGIYVCILFLRCFVFAVMIWCVFPLSFSYTFFYCLICCS